MFTKKYEDGALIDAYCLCNHSSVKAAEILGCSYMTVVRAIRRSGIEPDGREYNNGGWSRGCGSPEKITDEELKAEAKYMTRVQIAKKHHMNVVNIDRRLHRLHIKCKRAVKTRADKSGNHKERAAAYGVEYEPGITLAKVMKRDHGICQICGKPVDPGDKVLGTIGKDYPTIDHIIPMSKGGPHTWGNVQLAHMICNSRKCDSMEGENC